MMTPLLRLLRRLLPCILLMLPLDALAVGPAELHGFYRSGQTFLTWQEDDSVTGEWYRVYNAPAPITTATLNSATLIARVPEGSRRYRFLEGIDDKLKAHLQASYADVIAGVQLEDDDAAGKVLPPGTGVFVRTIKRPGKSYYAVVLEKGGQPSADLRPGVNALTQPIEERTEPPGAIRLKKLAENYYLYLFFTDFETWNPDKVDDNWEGYAHILQVRGPAGADPRTPFPLEVALHAYTAYKDWEIKSYPPKHHIRVTLLDYHNGWWFGYSDARAPANWPGVKVAPKGVVRNFTEQRLVQAISWLAGNPGNFPLRIDPDQVSLSGMSMGASGCNVFGMRHGGLFARIKSSKGITDWTLPADLNIWLESIVKHVGPAARDQMYRLGDGTPVYQALEMPRVLKEHPELDTPFIDLGFGSIDNVIPFSRVPDYWRALEAGKHPFAVSWRMEGHSAPLYSGSPMEERSLLRDESVPAFANASCNNPMRSGLRIIGKAQQIDATRLTIKPGSLKGNNNSSDKGSFPSGLAGKTLVIGAGPTATRWFKIKSNTPTTLTIDGGNLLSDQPPLSEWNLGQLQKELGHKPSDAELRAATREAALHFLVIDGDPVGTWNGYFAWSSKLKNFDPKTTRDDIVDEADRWAICVRLEENEVVGEWREKTAKADITPRRCQKFRPAPGEKVHWINYDYAAPAAPKVIAEGDVTVDRHGLVTVPGVVIGKGGWGSRLVISRKAAQPKP